jgi:hypothetical protein
LQLAGVAPRDVKWLTTCVLPSVTSTRNAGQLVSSCVAVTALGSDARCFTASRATCPICSKAVHINVLRAVVWVCSRSWRGVRRGPSNKTSPCLSNRHKRTRYQPSQRDRLPSLRVNAMPGPAHAAHAPATRWAAAPGECRTTLRSRVALTGTRSSGSGGPLRAL